MKIISIYPYPKKKYVKLILEFIEFIVLLFHGIDRFSRVYFMNGCHRGVSKRQFVEMCINRRLLIKFIFIK